MTTLYKRANPSQRRLLRIIEGAIKNASDAHSRNAVPQKFARSIAKRAAGTISAQWPELLAARMPSNRDASEIGKGFPASAAHDCKPPRQRGAAQPVKPSPIFKMLYLRLGAMAGWARKAGHNERTAAFADALRVIASVEAEIKDH